MSFDDAFATLIKNEGGYSNNPADPGGETMWGVTKRVAVADGYLGPMRDMPKERAFSIAKRLYWDPLRCDQYDARVAFQLLDANYNGGHVVLWMQQAAGAHADGAIGPATIAAVQAANPYIFMMRFLAFRLIYFTLCRPWLAFGKGWASRVANNLLKGAM